MRLVRGCRPLFVALLAASLANGIVPAGEEKEKIPTPQTRPAIGPGQSAGTPPQPEAQTAPVEPGVRTIRGTIVKVEPKHKAVVIQTAINQVRVFLLPRTELTRDGKKAGFETIRVLDRVDTCVYTIKGAARKLKLTSAAEAG